MKKNKNQAVVREIDGQLVLDDPMALRMIQINGKCNCEATFDLNADRVEHFKNRIAEKQLNSKDVVIVVINVDDPHGGPIADMLMPNFAWQEIRDRGEVPFARGLAMREGIEEVIKIFDKEASEKLKNTTGIAVVVVDHGVAEIFPV